MAAFFIASGYGFRKRSIRQSASTSSSKSLLKPYAIRRCSPACCTLSFIIKTFQYLPGTIGESIKVTGGFLLGLPHTASISGQEFFSCGPMWYLLALVVGWVLLDVILNIFPALCSMGCGSCVLLGWGASRVGGSALLPDPGVPWWSPYLYIGFLAKKHLLDEPLPPKVFAGLLAATGPHCRRRSCYPTTDCISLAGGHWGR